MLKQVCSASVRRPHYPRVSSNHYLCQINRECLHQLRKLEINASLQTTMEKIDTRYRLSIYQEVEYEYQKVPDHALYEPDDSPEAEERAKGHQLACGLVSTMGFLDKYSVTVPGITLNAAIHPAHRNFLIESLQLSFHALNESDRLAFASAVQPDVLHKAGLKLSPEERKRSVDNYHAGVPQLKERHLLALLDTSSSRTGSFNAVNDAKRTWQLCGVDKLAAITACLADPLDEALQILSQHDVFAYEGPAYKGISVCNGAGQYRLSKMQPGMLHTSPHWSSATWISGKNYALNNGRDLQVTLLHAVGVRVHLFNDISSIDEGEIAMQPIPMHFVSASEVDQHRHPPNSSCPTIYCTMKPSQQDSGIGQHEQPGLTAIRI